MTCPAATRGLGLPLFEGGGRYERLATTISGLCSSLEAGVPRGMCTARVVRGREVDEYNEPGGVTSSPATASSTGEELRTCIYVACICMWGGVSVRHAVVGDGVPSSLCVWTLRCVQNAIVTLSNGKIGPPEGGGDVLGGDTLPSLFRSGESRGDFAPLFVCVRAWVYECVCICVFVCIRDSAWVVGEGVEAFYPLSARAAASFAAASTSLCVCVCVCVCVFVCVCT